MSETCSGDVLRFWFDEIDETRWFRVDDEFDREIEQRFGRLLTQGKNGELGDWHSTARGSLALIIVLDQFSRNIHRGTARAFDADPGALSLALDGMRKGFDDELTLAQRAFYYLPLRHAEDLGMQELGLKKTRELNAAGYGSDKYALSHLDIIRRFGRFPHRNRALGRSNTAEEQRYLDDGKAGF